MHFCHFLLINIFSGLGPYEIGPQNVCPFLLSYVLQHSRQYCTDITKQIYREVRFGSAQTVFRTTKSKPKSRCANEMSSNLYKVKASLLVYSYKHQQAKWQKRPNIK